MIESKQKNNSNQQTTFLLDNRNRQFARKFFTSLDQFRRALVIASKYESAGATADVTGLAK
jgi:hypothetical protein